MKRRILFIFLFLMAITLMACDKKDERFDKVFNEELITYATGDSNKHVTEDVTLKTSSETVEEAKISWESNKTQVIKIDGNKGIVTRTNEDTKVKLTATVTIDDRTKDKEFELVVIGIKDSEPTDPATSHGLVIKGTKNWTLSLGSSLPDFLKGVSATDLDGNKAEVKVLYNTVDPTTIGEYVVVYEAVKGDQKATKTVYVTVEPKSIATEWLTETFDHVEDTGSSYSDFTFTGVNNIEWHVFSGRTDVPLDGSAVTFRGRSENDRIEATITGGIKHFSVDLKTAIEKSKTRIVELYIKDEKIADYELDANNKTDVQKFVVENINVEGEFKLELRQRGGGKKAQVIVDNLSWLPMEGDTIENPLQFEVSQIQIPMRYSEEGSFTLPLKTDEDRAIVWSYSDEDSTNNEYFDLTNGTVTLPKNGLVLVELVATISNGTETASKVFTVVIGDVEVSPIIVVRHEENHSNIATIGVVTDFYITDNAVKFFIEDETAGIFVIADKAFANDIEIGHKVLVSATKTVEHNQEVLVNVTDIKVQGTNEVVKPKQLEDPKDLLNHLGQFVQMNGLLRDKFSEFTEDYWLVNEFGEFQIVIPEDLPESERQAIRTLLSQKEAGLEVTIKAGVAAQGARVYLLAVDVDSIDLNTTLNVDRIQSIIISNFEEPEIPDVVENDLTLPAYYDLYFGADIEWTSSHEAIVSSTGKVNLPDEQTTVTLSYEITLNGIVIHSNEFEFIVQKRPSFDEYYQSLEGLSGSAFKAELSRIISTGAKNLGYDAAKYVLPESDQDPNNPNNMILVYNRASIEGEWDGAATWNREHVWPQSKLNGASKSDLHNLKPSNPGINSRRGSLPFVDGSGSYGPVTGGWYPGDEDRGDIARIIFYMVTRYEQLSVSTMGDLNTLIRWHYEDPVDDFERHRNEVIYQYQNNRNPFIDHPEFVAMIYDVPTEYLMSTAIDLHEFVKVEMIVLPTTTTTWEDKRLIA